MTEMERRATADKPKEAYAARAEARLGQAATPAPATVRSPLWKGAGAEDDAPRPRAPEDLEDIGLSPVFIEDLILKTLYARGASTGEQVSAAIRLPFWALDGALLSFQRQKLVFISRAEGVGRRGSVFELTTEGRLRARETFESSPYLGPAPVHLERYRYWMERQSVRKVRVDPERVRRGFEHMVLEPDVIENLGPAINAARSIFIWGAPGNGKTTIAEAIVGMFDDSILIPYAVYADGEVVQIFDPVTHHPVETGADEPEPLVFPPPSHDDRFVRVKRPLVIVGGELTLDQLELHYDRNSGSYNAPPHMKANGGVFVIDDFGRQHLPPRELLNRWMIPLDRGIDYLSFGSGRRIRIPFACVVVFATNLEPQGLVEEAFLRRIHYKVHVGTPGRESFEEIFRRSCERNRVGFDPRAVSWIYSEYYDAKGITPRACHAVDLVEKLHELADYLRVPVKLNSHLLAEVCKSYFMDIPLIERPAVASSRKGDLA